jgi:hypothetical protein
VTSPVAARAGGASGTIRAAPMTTAGATERTLRPNDLPCTFVPPLPSRNVTERMLPLGDSSAVSGADTCRASTCGPPTGLRSASASPWWPMLMGTVLPAHDWQLRASVRRNAHRGGACRSVGSLPSLLLEPSNGRLWHSSSGILASTYGRTMPAPAGRRSLNGRSHSQNPVASDAPLAVLRPKCSRCQRRPRPARHGPTITYREGVATRHVPGGGTFGGYCLARVRHPTKLARLQREV